MEEKEETARPAEKEQYDQAVEHCLNGDTEKAEASFESLVEKDFLAAEVWLYGIDPSNKGKKEKANAAFAWLSKQDQSQAWVQSALGFCYQEGIGVENDLTQALTYYEVAAKKNYLPALLNLGIYYAQGTVKNLIEAFEYFQRAADLGHVRSQYYVGLCFETGEISDPEEETPAPSVSGRAKRVSKKAHIEVNLLNALHYYQLAAEKGNADAQYKLGELYEQGRGVIQNQKTAEQYFHLAAKGGHKKAQEKAAEFTTNAFPKAVNKSFGDLMLPLKLMPCEPLKASNIRKDLEQLAEKLNNLSQQAKRVKNFSVSDEDAQALVVGTTTQGLNVLRQSAGSLNLTLTQHAQELDDLAKGLVKPEENQLAEALKDCANALTAQAEKLAALEGDQWIATLDQQIAKLNEQIKNIKDLEEGLQAGVLEAAKFYRRHNGMVLQFNEKDNDGIDRPIDLDTVEKNLAAALCYGQGVGGCEENKERAIAYYQKALELARPIQTDLVAKLAAIELQKGAGEVDKGRAETASDQLLQTRPYAIIATNMLYGFLNYYVEQTEKAQQGSSKAQDKARVLATFLPDLNKSLDQLLESPNETNKTHFLNVLHSKDNDPYLGDDITWKQIGLNLLVAVGTLGIALGYNRIANGRWLFFNEFIDEKVDVLAGQVRNVYPPRPPR